MKEQLVALRISEAMKNRSRDVARKYGMTFSELVRYLLQKKIDFEEAEERIASARGRMGDPARSRPPALNRPVAPHDA